jgi:ABC-type lipoprotein export system ATPase subunit
MTTKIELERVSHKYVRGTSTVTAFDGLSLAIRSGEFVSIVGP